MLNNYDDVRERIDKLNYYTKLYDEGHPIITDEEWDNLYFELQEWEKEHNVILANSPTNHISYQVVNQLNKVKHNHLMLSLAKTKSEEEILKFLEDYDAIAMAKMDGLTCSIRYLDGKLVSAETRGNGEVGEDITHNIFFVKGVPSEIPIKEEVIIDGEVICTYDDFEQFSSEYANPRNFASGSIRLLDSTECAKRHLTFIAWDCIKGLNDNKLTEKLYKLNNLGFIIVPYIPYLKEIERTSDKIKHINSLIKENAKEFKYPIDGIVYKYNDCNLYSSLGATGHHFRGGIAFKFYDEEYETYLQDIEWSIGKTAQLTPVAIFNPVDTGDSVISRASIHNLNIMEQLLNKPYKNQKIWVCKQNEIIPQIVGSEIDFIGEKEYINIPIKCPYCGESTIIKDDFLYCSNKQCSGILINCIDHYVGKSGLDIKGLSEKTLEKLIDWGWLNSISDLYKLKSYKNDWIKKDGFGLKSVDNILSMIDDRSTDCELWQFISALSIPLIGVRTAKDIAKREAGWLQFMEDIGPHMLGSFDFTEWEGFGPEMNKALHNFNYTEANYLIDEGYVKLHNSLYISESNQIINNNNISGKIFCVTGKLEQFKNRQELIDAVEAQGGKVANSISKKTNYLVTNDTTSGSSKNVKAKELNIPIITELELIDML